MSGRFSVDVDGFDYVVFDCDGVILDSNQLKVEAYAKALEGEPAGVVERFVDYHKKNGGISRYEKFRLFYEQMRPTKDAQKHIDAALARFSNIVRQGMIDCEYVPGFRDFVAAVKKKGLPLFVSSGSDEDELKDVFRERGIDGEFELILGSPANKRDNTRRIAAAMGAGKKGVFFGDALADAEAAADAGLDFIFVKGCSLWKDGDSFVKQRGCRMIENFLAGGTSPRAEKMA